ncbi:MAG: response regulator [Ktedonobacteraceae bacterium]
MMTKHVLVIDDHRDIRIILQTLLEKEGYAVTLAQDGLEALEQLETTTPSIILLDLGLPRMDGYAFLDALEQRNPQASIPVIVLTADKLAVEKLAQRNVHVILKPFTFVPLLAAMLQYV